MELPITAGTDCRQEPSRCRAAGKCGTEKLDLEGWAGEELIAWQRSGGGGEVGEGQSGGLAGSPTTTLTAAEASGEVVSTKSPPVYPEHVV